MTNLRDYNLITSQISLTIWTHFSVCKSYLSNCESFTQLKHAYKHKEDNKASNTGNVYGKDKQKQDSSDEGCWINKTSPKRKNKGEKLSKSKRISMTNSKRTRKPRKTVPTTTIHPRLDIIPKLMIFEPDKLLWPFHYETDVVLPYDLVQPTAWPIPKPGDGRRWCTGNFGGRELVDNNGKCLQLNYDALVLFYKLQHRGIKLALAATLNNSSKVDGMHQLIRLFEFDYVVSYVKVGVGSPVDHVKTIKQQSGLEFRDLVYLGINKTVLEEINNELKVITVYVDQEKGLDVKDVQEGGRLYAIRPHVPGPFETPLTVGKIVSNEEAANIYEPEVMKMEERDESDSITSGNLYRSSEEGKIVEISKFDLNLTVFNL